MLQTKSIIVNILENEDPMQYRSDSNSVGVLEKTLSLGIHEETL